MNGETVIFEAFPDSSKHCEVLVYIPSAVFSEQCRRWWEDSKIVSPLSRFCNLWHCINFYLYRIFTARAYARAVLGVIILSVRLTVCPSVTRVDCDKTKWRTADIFIPHERAITLLLWYQEWLVGDAPFPLKSAFKVTHPLRKTPTSTDFHS